jgi:hypothetical protein
MFRRFLITAGAAAALLTGSLTGPATAASCLYVAINPFTQKVSDDIRGRSVGTQKGACRRGKRAKRSNSHASGSIDETTFKSIASLTCFRDVRFALNKRRPSGHSEIDAMCQKARSPSPAHAGAFAVDSANANGGLTGPRCNYTTCDPTEAALRPALNRSTTCLSEPNRSDH